MISAAELGGFFAAHAIWCVSDGEPLVTMLAHGKAGGPPAMERLVGELPQMVEQGRAKLASNAWGADDAALLFDGFIHLPGGKVDAILVELRAYAAPAARATWAVPYTPGAGDAFRVHRPKLVEWSGCGGFEQRDAIEAFWRGVGRHEKGNAVWSAHLDESR